MDNGLADGGQPSAPSDEVPGRWQQRAGFSVFFDAQATGPGGSGELRRRTRLYHEETGNETTLRGWEPTDWVGWILDRLGSAQPPSAPADATASLVSTVAVELQLRVTGMAGLRQTLRAKVAGVRFGPAPQ